MTVQWLYGPISLGREGGSFMRALKLELELFSLQLPPVSAPSHYNLVPPSGAESVSTLSQCP